VVDLPDYISPDAVVTLTNGGGCSFTKILKSDAGYLHAKEACASGAPVAATQTSPVLFPNPSNGIFNCSQNGSVATADEVLVYNTQGIKVGSFKNVRQFNISNAVAGLYMYQMTINGVVYKGKVVKM
jgi:hypothetical protein